MKITKHKKLTTGVASLAVFALATGVSGGVASACSVDGDYEHDSSSYSYSYESESGWDGSTAYTSHEGNAQYASQNDQSQNDEYLHQVAPPLYEHAALGVSALRATYLSEPDLAAIKNAVDLNNTNIAAVVEAGYPGTHDEFLSLWESHLSYYEAYLTAAANGDEAGKAAAKQKLGDFTVEVSQLLANSSDQLNADELQSNLAVHGDQVTMIIDKLVTGDFDGAWQLGHEAYEHMGMISYILAEGAQNGQGDDQSLNEEGYGSEDDGGTENYDADSV